jgi:hypothetical protein
MVYYLIYILTNHIVNEMFIKGTFQYKLVKSQHTTTRLTHAHTHRPVLYLQLCQLSPFLTLTKDN